MVRMPLPPVATTTTTIMSAGPQVPAMLAAGATVIGIGMGTGLAGAATTLAWIVAPPPPPLLLLVTW
jgi:hypothetical protein